MIFSGVASLIGGLFILPFVGFQAFDLQVMLVLLAGAIGMLAILFYFMALALDETSRVAALFQLVPVIVITLSFVLFGQKLTIRQDCGAVLVIASSLYLSGGREVGRLFIPSRAFWLMALSSLAYAGVYLIMQPSVRNLGFWQVLPYEGVGAGVFTVVLLLWGRNLQTAIETFRTAPLPIAVCLGLSEVLYRMSRYSVFFALTLLPAGIVSVLEGAQPLVVLLLVIILTLFRPSILSEDISLVALRDKFLACLGLVAGVALIVL